MADSCYAGDVPLSGTELGGGSPLPGHLLTTCSPGEGLCYSALNRAAGLETVQVGCWPVQNTVRGLAWLVAPDCRPEVDRLVCLCRSSLCNYLVPAWPPDPEPEGDEVHGLLLLLPVVALVLITLVTVTLRAHTRDKDTEAGEHIFTQQMTQTVTPPPGSFVLTGGQWQYQPRDGAGDGGPPPPLARYYSAPPCLPSSPTSMRGDLSSLLPPHSDIFLVPLSHQPPVTYMSPFPSQLSQLPSHNLEDVRQTVSKIGEHYNNLLLNFNKLAKSTDV